jgi:hypothetical protein
MVSACAKDTGRDLAPQRSRIFCIPIVSSLRVDNGVFVSLRAKDTENGSPPHQRSHFLRSRNLNFPTFGVLVQAVITRSRSCQLARMIPA